MDDVTPLGRRALQAVQKAKRIRAIAEDVNDGRPGWDTISDADVRGLLEELQARGYVQQTRGGFWLRAERGVLP